MKKNFFLIAVTSVLAFGCNFSDDVKTEKIGTGPILLSAELQKRVAQDNEFALDMLRNTIKGVDDDNVFISPLSISVALGMARNGADGSTRTEMETALRMSGLSSDEINEYYRIMLDSLPTADFNTTLKIANSIWYRNGFQVKQPFLDINATFFNSEIRSLDFSKSGAVDSINDWCALKTNNLIKNVITEIPELAMMYLINAVYFKGQWTYQFDKKRTFSTNFTDELGKMSEVNMMNRTDTFAYFRDTDAEYLDLPYGSGAFSMTVILPSIGKTTGDVLDNLNTDRLNTAIGQLKKQKVAVSIPRFKAECKYKLSRSLQDMGMKKAFEDIADFSKISDQVLYISSIIHKTYVEVTEEGTEAAAVTVIEFETTSLPEYPIFSANRPFLFLIREKGTGIILFAGKMGAVEKY